MAVKFHESLPLLTRTLRESGLPLDENTVIVRDGGGRLIVARKEMPDASALQTAVRQALGAYAGTHPVIDGRLAKALLADPAAQTLELPDGLGRIRFIDRRFVGSEWLGELAPGVETGPQRLVFASLKGGVGRSTALAVLAAELARQGKKTLVIDLDLEAPGIGFMLLEESEDVGKDKRPKYGVLDYLVENGLGRIEDEELTDFIGVSGFVEGSVDVIPVVGRTTDEHPEDMLAKLSRAFVADQSPQGSVSFAHQVRAMVDRFAAWKNYDAVLIDARAGLAESSAAALLALGGRTLFFGVDQPQTFRGYGYLFAHLRQRFGGGEAYDDWRRRVSFVQAKAPAHWGNRINFRDNLHELCSDYLYDREELNEDGTVDPPDFNFAWALSGRDVPHDFSYIKEDPLFRAFNPAGDRLQLDLEIYTGPFGDFLRRSLELLNISDGEGEA
jgi:Mrp family chromosome partitioning ATPase